MKNYSGGMRRRIDIAASIIVTPEMLFLDEPTTGLDPRSRNQVWDIVRALVAGGTTVLLTTQYLDEADQLADRMAVIDHGKVIAEGTTGELKASVGSRGPARAGHRHRHPSPPRRALLRDVLEVPIVEEADPAALTARIDDPARVARALPALDDAGIAVSTFALGQPSLDEVFLSLTGRPTEEHAS